MAEIHSRFVLVDGLKTHYLEGGNGFPLVLLHSGEFGGCAELTWEFNLAALAEHFRVIAPDWLGFGQSAKILSFEDMAGMRVRHIAAFLRTLCIGRAHFMGNSMGGSVLASVAALDDCPWPIARIVLASGGGFAPENESRQVLNTYDGSRAHMARIVDVLVRDPKLRHDEAYIDKRHRISLEPGAWECTAAARFRRPGAGSKSGNRPASPGNRNIKAPTLIIAGGQDPLRNPGYADELQQEIAGSALITFAAAGHCPQIDEPDRLNRVVAEFLSR